MKRKSSPFLLTLCLSAAVIVAVYVLYSLNILPHKRFTNADFGIPACVSAVDADGDGVDDQTDILQSARDYVASKPVYKSAYYASGYPDDGCGVCTDVVAFALRGAGYDLMELVNEDILRAPEQYGVATPDRKIDFRRVRNLAVYFKNTARALTTELDDIGEWQGGDIVIFRNHIGIVSDARNKKGVPFLIHHAGKSQLRYEEDVLERYKDQIVGHYRVS